MTTAPKDLTLRDYFAAHILNGWLAAKVKLTAEDRDWIATRAYAMADAMLAARKVVR